MSDREVTLAKLERSLKSMESQIETVEAVARSLGDEVALRRTEVMRDRIEELIRVAYGMGRA